MKEECSELPDDFDDLRLRWDEVAGWAIEKRALNADPNTPCGVAAILRYQFGPDWQQRVTEAINYQNASGLDQSQLRRGKPYLIRSDTWKKRKPRKDSPDDNERRAALKAERNKLVRKIRRQRRRRYSRRNAGYVEALYGN